MTHDPVNHPRHYTAHPSGLECIDITRLLTCDIGNAVKYVWRADLKNGLEDLRKAEFYLMDNIRFIDILPPWPVHNSAMLWRRLNQVADAEPDALKQAFYRHICHTDLVDAVDTVRAMIARAEQETI